MNFNTMKKVNVTYICTKSAKNPVPVFHLRRTGVPMGRKRMSSSSSPKGDIDIGFLPIHSGLRCWIRIFI